jgi:hypothetical protein
MLPPCRPDFTRRSVQAQTIPRLTGAMHVNHANFARGACNGELNSATRPNNVLIPRSTDCQCVVFGEGAETIFEPRFLVIKTWLTEGREDPRITVIKVKPTAGYYWDTKHGSAIAGAKLLIGAAIGKTLDDSVEGELVF